MIKRNSIGADKRVPVAMCLMAFVLTLLGSKHLLAAQGGPEAVRPGQPAFAATASVGR
jgi:hypothetical protein